MTTFSPVTTDTALFKYLLKVGFPEETVRELFCKEESDEHEFTPIMRNSIRRAILAAQLIKIQGNMTGVTQYLDLERYLPLVYGWILKPVTGSLLSVAPDGVVVEESLKFKKPQFLESLLPIGDGVTVSILKLLTSTRTFRAFDVVRDMSYRTLKFINGEKKFIVDSIAGGYAISMIQVFRIIYTLIKSPYLFHRGAWSTPRLEAGTRMYFLTSYSSKSSEVRTAKGDGPPSPDNVGILEATFLSSDYCDTKGAPVVSCVMRSLEDAIIPSGALFCMGNVKWW